MVHCIGRTVRALAFAVAGAALAGMARDLVWLGQEDNGDWDLVTPNWYVKGDETKTRVCFESGDNAFFLESEWERATVRFVRTDFSTWVKEFDIGTVVVSNDVQTFSWSCNGYSYVGELCFQPLSIDKYGDGDFDVNYGFEWNCDFTVHGGRFLSGYSSTHTTDNRNPAGSMIVNRTVTFLSNTTWYATSSGYGFGGAGNAGQDNGRGNVHVVFSNATVDASGNLNHYVNFPKTTFWNATAAFGTTDYDTCSLLFSGDLAIGGTRSTTFASRSMTFGKKTLAPITIDVADATGDDASDFIVSGRIGNTTVVANPKNYSGDGRFIKTGAGTMELANVNNTFTGNVVVAEGTLLVPYGTDIRNKCRKGPLGPVDVRDKSVTVKSGGTLQMGVFSKNDNFPISNPNAPVDYVVSIEEGGRLRLADGTHMFGELALCGGELTYQNGAPQTWIEYALMTIGRKMSFSGTAPYDLDVRGTHNVMYLGFTLDSVRDDAPISLDKPHLTNLWSVVEFEVADVTGDDDVDAAIGLPMRDLVNVCYPTYGYSPNSYTYAPWKWARFRDGVRKTGAGTLRLYGENGYTHVTEVAEGTLQVDGSIASSSGVAVDAGAFLGGTGVVSAVTVAAGGGFVVDGAKARADVLKIPSLTCAGSVVVRPVNVAEETVTRFRQGICRLQDKPAEVDFSGWKVDSPHAKPIAFRFGYDPATGVVDVRYAPPGLTLVIR